MPKTAPRPFACYSYWAIVALQVVAIWSPHYYPSCDGPSHVHNAVQLGRWLAGDAQLREYFTLNPAPESNWFGHLLLLGLIKLTNPALGERLLITLYLILFPLAVRYAVRALRPAAAPSPVAWLALPLSLNWMLHDGFYFNAISLPALFGMVGWWWPRRTRTNALVVAGLAGWLLLLYFTHPVTLIIAVATLGSVFAWELFTSPPQQRPTRGIRNLILAFLPALIVLLWANADRIGFAHWGDPEVSFVKKVIALATLYFGLVSFSMRELAFGAAVAFGFWLLIALHLWQRRGTPKSATDGWLVAMLVTTALFLASPESLAHGWYLVHRLNLYPFLIALCWLAAQSWRPRLARAVMFCFGAIALLQAGYYAWQYQRAQPYLREYVELGRQIPPGSTLLAIGISNRGHAPDGTLISARTKPFEFGASRIGLERGVIVLNDYQAHIGNFPFCYRPERDPFTHIGNVLMVPPRFEKGGPLTYPARTGGRVDTILWWQDRTDKLPPAIEAELRGPLDAGYTLIATSLPNGYGRLYRRNAP